MKKILCNKAPTGYVIHGECLMLDKYGDVYNCIDNAYHPNPGTAEDDYSEIERVVDWIFENDLRGSIETVAYDWLNVRVAQELYNDIDASFDDLLYNIMYCDTYDPCDKTKSLILEIMTDMKDDESYAIIDKWERLDDVKLASRVAYYLNQNFLRVRAGGKFDSIGEDTIYFRISSQGYNWRRVIEDFLWDTFGNINNMPSRIWIGHDAETNPPEITLFDGSPEEFFNEDQKIVATKLV